MADDERRKRPRLHGLQPALDARRLLGEGLTAREAEAGIGRQEAGEALGVTRLHLGEREIRPVARVGLREAGVLARLEADPRADDVRRLPRPGERAAPQGGEVVLA